MHEKSEWPSTPARSSKYGFETLKQDGDTISIKLKDSESLNKARNAAYSYSARNNFGIKTTSRGLTLFVKRAA